MIERGVNNRNIVSDIAIFVFGIAFCVAAFEFLHKLFDRNLDAFSTAILCAVLGSVFTVICMGVLMRLQQRHESRREFTTHVFAEKLRIYTDLIMRLFMIDDDGVITKEEITDLENRIGVVALVADVMLVQVLSQFLIELKTYGCIYFRSMSETQRLHFTHSFLQPSSHIELTTDPQRRLALSELRKHSAGCRPMSDEYARKMFISLDDVVQALRHDLSVVQGNINVHHLLEAFVQLPYDPYHLIRDPNLVDNELTHSPTPMVQSNPTPSRTNST